MKAKDLKNSILQMAIEGKLVPQDPNDEPASVLLERIREEKHKLIAEGKAKFPKGGESVIYIGSDGSPYEKRVDAKGRVTSDKCIADEVPFEELPEGWCWSRLSSFFTKMGSGSTPVGGRKVYQDEGPMLIRSQNVHNEGLRLDDVAHFSRSLFSRRGSHVLPNDMLLNITGASIGRCAIVPNTFGDADVNQHVLIMRPVLQIVSGYLHAAIISPLVQSAIMVGQVGATKEGLSATKAADLLIPLPPLAEQRRIVGRVNELMPLVEEYGGLEDAREALDAALPGRLRKSVLQLAVRGGLVPQDPADEPAGTLLERIRGQRRQLVAEKKMKAPKGGESIIFAGSDGRRYEKRVDARGRESEPVCIEDEIPFEIPEGWEWARMGSVFSMQAGKNIKASLLSDIQTENTPYPCFGGNGVRGFVAKPNASGDYPIIGRQGALCGNVRRASGDFYATEHAVVVRCFLNADIAWACLFLSALNLNQYATATAQPGLAVSKISDVLIPIPPLAEQHRIVDRFVVLEPLVTNQ